MNDDVSGESLTPFHQAGWIDGLATPRETRPAKGERTSDHNPTHSAWTHRYKASKQAPRFELYDQVWLSPSLAAKQTEAWIDRRTKHSGDGSDHDPAWVTLRV
jgi:exonuclease III